MFPGARPASTPMVDRATYPPSVGSTKPTSKHHQEQRSKSNQLNYLRRKNATIGITVVDLKAQVAIGVKREAVLQKDAEKQTKFTKKADDSAVNMMSTLTST